MQTSQKHAAQRIHSGPNNNPSCSVSSVRRTLICGFVLAITVVYSQLFLVYCAAQQVRDKAIESSPIRLVLQTSKSSYHVGEPVEALGYLENRGNSSYYVGDTILSFFGTSELHEIKLKILDANGREVPIGGGGGSWIWKHGTTINEKLALAYTQLRPRTIFGLKERLPVSLKPGRYQLIATYRELEALSWTDAERKASPIPVWTQPLVSNTVEITVIAPR